jgi:hypothetical protein
MAPMELFWRHSRRAKGLTVAGFGRAPGGSEQSGVFDAGSVGDTSPQVAAQQLGVLYRNQKEISDLQNLRRSGAPRGSYTGTC